MAKNYYSLILKNFHLKDEDVINVYPFGSKIYKTDNYRSDYDFIVVVKQVSHKDDRKKIDNININIYGESSFLDQLTRNRMSALECIFLPKELVLKESKKIDVKINLSKLRLYSKEKSIDDWNRAEKAFHAEEPIFIKSIFHAIRTLDFTHQIIEYGKIKDYSSCNHIWEHLNNSQFDNWEDYNEVFVRKFDSLYQQVIGKE